MLFNRVFQLTLKLVYEWTVASMKGCGCFTVGTGRAGHIKRITAWIQQRWLWKAPERLTGLVMWTGMSFILDRVETAKNANSSLVNEVANSYMYTGRMSLTSTQKISITAQYAKLRPEKHISSFHACVCLCVHCEWALWHADLRFIGPWWVIELWRPRSFSNTFTGVLVGLHPAEKQNLL